MNQQAEILRIVYGADGAILPGEIVDISEWNPENVRAMKQDGRIRIVEDESNVADLHAQIKAQAERIEELKIELAVVKKANKKQSTTSVNKPSFLKKSTDKTGDK